MHFLTNYMNAAVIFVSCSSSVQVSALYRMVRIVNVLCICSLVCF
jgi:hypothetical protein